MVSDGVRTVHEAAQHNLAWQLKDEAMKAVPDIGSSVHSDLLYIALDRVNWLELAENLLTDLVA